MALLWLSVGTTAVPRVRVVSLPASARSDLEQAAVPDSITAPGSGNGCRERVAPELVSPLTGKNYHNKKRGRQMAPPISLPPRAKLARGRRILRLLRLLIACGVTRLRHSGRVQFRCATRSVTMLHTSHARSILTCAR